MVTVAAIVEGKGEVEAVPILLRRVAAQVSPNVALNALRPIRMQRTRMLNEGQLERAVELAARRSGEQGRILILLDADDDCPKDLAAKILRRAEAVRRDRIIRVVLAKREYEAWFLAAAHSISGQRGIDEAIAPPAEPEAIRGAKEWLSGRMPRGRAYSPTSDQPALTAVFDMNAARSAPSFDKLWRDATALLAG